MSIKNQGLCLSTSENKNIYDIIEVFNIERIDEADGKNKFVCIESMNEPDYENYSN